MPQSKIIFKFLFLSFFIFFVFIFFTQPERYARACFDGLMLWATNVLPSLLPFMFLTSIFTHFSMISNIADKLRPLTKRFFKLDGISAYCFLMSAISGYPVGSKITADLYENGRISEKDATKMSALCSTSGPAFVIGTVGCVFFRDVIVGVIMYFCHISAVVIVCFLFARFQHNENYSLQKEALEHKKCDSLLFDCMSSSILSLLCVGGFIAVFSVFLEMAENIPLFKDENAFIFLSCIAEVTNACKALSDNPCVFSQALACATITFGGSCIILQQLCFFMKAKINVRYFLLTKFFQSVIAFILYYAVYVLIM